MTTFKRPKDACELLDADHKAVSRMFKDFESLCASRALTAPQLRLDLAREICRDLTVHTALEEEIFYPALRASLSKTLLAEAVVEHQTARKLIAQIEAAEQANEDFNAKVNVLKEYVDHHVKEERNEIFPKARSANNVDLFAMREQIQLRKQEMLNDLQVVP